MTPLTEYRFSLGGDHSGRDVGFLFSIRAPSIDDAVGLANAVLQDTPDAFYVATIIDDRLPGTMYWPCVCLNTTRVLTTDDIVDEAPLPGEVIG